MEKKTIGAFIAALRKANGLTQRQLAEMLSVSDKAVSRWERDEAMPDLTLIPVIAEIFHVTSDEILRGQRKTSEEPETKYETQRTEKQIQRIISKTVTNFRIQSTVSVGVSIIGFIAAVICNIFTRANLGFGVSCIFYVCSLICQGIFSIIGLNALNSDDLSSEQAASAKATIVKTSTLVVTLVVILVCATLPLITLIQDAYLGLGGSSWLTYGFTYALIGAGVCFILRYIVHIRLEYQKLPDMKKPKNKLRLRCIVILILVVFVTVVGHVSIHNYFWGNTHSYYPGTRWDNWEELKEYLETPVSEDGKPLTLVSCTPHIDYEECEYVDEDGYIYYLYNVHTVLVYEEDMQTPKYDCVIRNHEIRLFSYGHENDTLPIYTYTHAQYRMAEGRLEFINFCICVLYPLEVMMAVLIYRIRSKKRNEAP